VNRLVLERLDLVKSLELLDTNTGRVEVKLFCFRSLRQTRTIQ
jgi:hypothetical protein